MCAEWAICDVTKGDDSTLKEMALHSRSNHCLPPYLSNFPTNWKIKTVKPVSKRLSAKPNGKHQDEHILNGRLLHILATYCLLRRGSFKGTHLGKHRRNIVNVSPGRWQQRRRPNEDGDWRMTHAAKLPPFSPTVTEQICSPPPVIPCLAWRTELGVAAGCG